MRPALITGFPVTKDARRRLRFVRKYPDPFLQRGILTAANDPR